MRARKTATPSLVSDAAGSPTPRAPRVRSRPRRLVARLGHQLLRRLGFDVVRVKYLDDFATRRSLVLDGADTVVDVGANVGAYARLVRTAGFEGRIVSFEPLPSAFRRLSQAAASDSQWTCLPIGLTDETGVETLNVSQNLVSSSFLTVTSREARDAPETAVVDHVEAQVATLDSLRDRLFAPTERLFVKLDVQGAETRVLAGMPELLPQVVGIESELSIVPLYEGQETLSRVVALLGEHGFRLIALEPEYRDLRSGELKQVNGLFVASA